MSLEPEVPYDPLEQEHETWRDPTILSDSNAVQVDDPYVAPNSTVDYYDVTPMDNSKEPDGCWMVPPEHSLAEVLGPNRSHLNSIKEETSTYLEYNDTKHQVDIWGQADLVLQAKRLLDGIVRNLADKKAADSRRKTKKWGKPERELTRKEKERVERKLQYEQKMKSYQGKPSVPQNYNAYVTLPNQDIPVLKIMGEREEKVASIRADLLVYVYYDEKSAAFHIAGDEEYPVRTAAERVRNLYLRAARQPYRATLRLIKQPSKSLKVQFSELPSNALRYEYLHGDDHSTSIHRFYECYELMAPRLITDYNQDQNLIDFDETRDMPFSSPLPEALQSIDKTNEEKITEALELGLESVRLNDWELQMKVRFGQTHLIDYPKKDWVTVEKLMEYLPHPRFRSELAPCIARTYDQVKPLFEYLNNNCLLFNNMPYTQYIIEARQLPTMPQQPPPNSRIREPRPSAMEEWSTKMVAEFSEHGKPPTRWRVLVECHDLVNVSMTDLEAHYAWDLKLQYARRLKSEGNTPHNKFAEHLRVTQEEGKEQRLSYIGTKGYRPMTIKQKKIWAYGHGDWVFEVKREELWDMQDVPVTNPGLPVSLASIPPDQTQYKFSAHKEVWRNKMSHNTDLKMGEAPEWTGRDFLAHGIDSVKDMISTSQKLTDDLRKHVPIYWASEAQPSLV
ncbi:hypothetical protein BCR43DRAFT_481679 [Syncephalastrum racemosum]|uniref:DUF7905 domain-containing protein n=1 Tax=Syncephalastrum racemosum TaxID=13706 RepID=A0A1X2HSI3_SYNRA|nr:hypothetical protein BCR43DRAFT_481679 [Syncephalastrum racemosum]